MFEVNSHWAGAKVRRHRVETSSVMTFSSSAVKDRRGTHTVAVTRPEASWATVAVSYTHLVFVVTPYETSGAEYGVFRRAARICAENGVPVLDYNCLLYTSRCV